MPMVNVPHALSRSAFTTASPSPASAMTTMNRMAIAAVMPGDRADLGRAISASDRPPRAGRGQEDDEVVDGAAEADADDQPEKPGQKPNCAASTGPMSGPAPVIAAKWWPNSTHRFVGS